MTRYTNYRHWISTKVYIIRIFQPETVLGWHRELVHRKWTSKRKNRGGRPRMEKELENLILRLAQENPLWG